MCLTSVKEWLAPRSRVCACLDPSRSLFSQSPHFMLIRLTVAVLMLDIETEWTLNASLTTSSSYRKCSKRRTLDHSAQATSLLLIEGTTECSLIARGSGSGSAMVSAADLKTQCSNYPKEGARTSRHVRRSHFQLTSKRSETEREGPTPIPKGRVDLQQVQLGFVRLVSCGQLRADRCVLLHEILRFLLV